jgi:hypothetical protein
MAHPAEPRDGLASGFDYEPVHTSSQDDIRRPLSETPSYTQDTTAPIAKTKPEEKPRWESDL